MARPDDVTTKFKVDISELKSGITEANRQIRLVNSEFKAATAGMDDWGKSADGVSAKLKQLESVLGSEEDKLKNLQEQYRLTAEHMGENSKSAQELQIKINNQQAAVNKTAAELERYRNRLSEINEASEQAADGTQEFESAADRLKNTISEQESQLEKLKAAYSNVALEQGTNSREAEELAREIQSLSSELRENQNELSNAENAADRFDETLDDLGDSAENAGDGFTIMKGALAELVADGIKAAINSLKDLMTASSEANANFQAQTGASTAEMKEFKDEIDDLYKRNFGESLQDVADSMAQIKQQAGDMDPSKISELTQYALTLRDTFGFEVNESMRTAKMLIDQFGMSGKDAFALIAQGAQKGLDKNGDLLDSINEYSVHYQQLGYDADEFFNSLANGTAAGTFSVDKLGDAMKEFGIRVKDTAKSTDDGFALLGLNADEMRNKFVEGGLSARQATQQVLDVLFNMNDKVAQNQAGVALFGTMWEDLGAKGVQALTNIHGEIEYNREALDELAQIKYSDIGSQFKEIGRIIQVDFLQPLAEKALPVVQDFLNTVKDNLPEIKQAFIDLVPAIAGVGTAIATAFVVNKITAFVGVIGKAITAFKGATTAIGGMKAAMAVLNITMAANPIGLIITLIAGLVAAFVTLWNTSDEFRQFWIDLWETIKSVCGKAVDAIGKFFNETIPEAFNQFVQFLSEIPGKIVEFFINTTQKVAEWGIALGTKAKEIGSEFLNSIVSFFQQLPENIGYIIGFVLGQIAEWGVNLYNWTTTEIPKFINTVIQFFSELPGKIWEWLVQTSNKVAEWGYNLGVKAKEIGSQFLETTINFFKELPGKVWDWLVETVNKVIQWGSDLIDKAKEIGSNFVDSFISFFTDLPGKMLDIGSNIVSGLWEGIQSGADWLWNQITGFANGIIDGFRDAFDINSPSKAMSKQIGKWIPAGIAEGIKGNLSVVRKSADEMLKSIDLDWPDFDPRGPVGNGGPQNSNTPIVFNQYNNSPKALSRLEIYRQTRNQLQAIEGVI